MNSSRLLACALVSALLSPPLTAGESCCAAPATPAATGDAVTLPGESIYHLAATWRDQSGREVTLADFAGSPVLASMVFTHCAYACPRLIFDLKAAREALPPDVRERVRIVVASFDTVRDTPERLQEWARLHGFGPEWSLLHGDAGAVRELSVLLDIPFVPQRDGNFGHANRIVLLDADGVPVASVEGLGASPAPLVVAATELVRGNGSRVAVRADD